MMKRTGNFASSATTAILVVSLNPNLIISAHIFFNRLSFAFLRFSSHDMHLTYELHLEDLKFTGKNSAEGGT